ncbi:heat shock factor protein isoform X2 [Daktulosphaira vitifoliae]|uniref:heat shock factor protein isoform X2 n=1 Tax=Daktulosphaira vitifoliae TaxID=58002 RepID=UPI0021AAAB57|nr:heat shock factor protein isoform X2 [Daktulosphaira vitifoliae]
MPDNNPVNDQRIPLFLRKLWTLVNSPDTNNVITWSKEGDSFIIKSQVAFCDVLPRYFKHNNFMSFVRQLHIYGFSKRISDVDHTSNHGSSSSCEYAHPYFQKDHSCLLLSIKQKRGEKVQQNIKPDIDSIDTISNLIKEVNQVKDKNKLLDSKFIAMKHENECLWRELAVIRQKHMKQQRILNQLIQFLVTLRQPRNNDALCREVKNNVRYVLPIMHHKPSEKNTKYKPSTSSGPVIHELDPSDIIINSSDNENNSVAIFNEVVEPEDVVLSPSSVSQILSSPRSSIAEEVLLPNEVIANSPLDDLIREVSVSPTDDLLEPKSTFIPISSSTSIPDTAPLFNSSGKRTKHDSSIKKKPHISNETKSFKVESLRNPYIVNVETDGNNPPVISIPDTEVLDPGVSIPNDNILWNEITPENNMQLANPEPRESVSKHIDSVQADLENILKGLNDKYTFDANTFLNFINEDPTSLSLPITTEEQLLNDSKNELNVTHDNQIVSCMSPNTYDLNDLMSASVDWSVPSTPISFETIGENNDVLNTPVIGDPMMNADSYFTPSTKPAKK